MGRLQRKYGLTLDNLVSVDVVTADGRLVHASEDENPDLFWGMRGAGPNFGIATSFEFRLHPVGPTITHGTVVYPVERTAEVAEFYRDFVENTPDELWSAFGLGIACRRRSIRPRSPAGPSSSWEACTAALWNRRSATSPRCGRSERRSRTASRRSCT